MIKFKDIDQYFSNIIKIIFIIILGFILPLLLIPVIKLVGYSEIVEEISKALVVLFLISKLSSWKIKIFIGIIFGFLFGLSETMFFLNNIFQLGNFSIFWDRFFWTVPMHIITVLIMIISVLAGRKFLFFGFIGAIIFHLFFNFLIINL